MPGELEELRNLVQKVKKYVAEGVSLQEADTKAALVVPLLAWLGWDTTDPFEVKREWKKKGQTEPVDYALCEGDNPLLLIEAKALGDSLKADKPLWQLIKYVPIAETARWCALTSGRLIVLVNADQKGPLEGKIFWRLDLARVGEPGEQSLEQAERRLKLLSKAALSGGDTDRAWDEEQTQAKTKSAVESLLSAPSEELVELVRKQPGAAGLPTPLIATRLAALVGKEPPLQPHPQPAAKAPAPTPGQKAVQSQRRMREKGFVLLGQRYSAESWTDMFVQVCGLMYAMHPSEFSQVLTMGTNKHKWFSRNPGDLVRPRLVPATDIYVYANLSARDCLSHARKIIKLLGHDPGALVVEGD
jgi:hypothetical protein